MLLPRSKQARNKICAPHRAQNAAASTATAADTRTLRQRYLCYNPQDGRWTRREPIDIEGGINLYNCSKSNPIAYYDDKGLSIEELFCKMNAMDPEREYEACKIRCSEEFTRNLEAVEDFTASAAQANNSIGVPRGKTPQEIIAAFVLYPLVLGIYRSCLSKCTYTYQH